ncbi:hypothetical protein [Streptomyces sp. NRRL S-241]|uniref:hypothetical protein n=1 Tax=Streptomyces sp. NRRL S-241 TaxID=1463896 RepID=UPI0004BEFBB4|nr:hypothetical protein [Streptomyces sp. NRRL S-241]
MITDPELGEDWQTEPLEQAPARAGSGRERPAPRPWQWALGGAVVASAVWAGGLYAFGGLSADPEISYRASENLCQDFAARTLGGIAGDLHKLRPVNHESSNRAVDGAVCSLSNVEGAQDFTVTARVDLHKKADPSVEFDAPPLTLIAHAGEVRTEAVPGLGERAAMTAIAGEQILQLKAIDGGAQFSIDVSVATFGEHHDRPATDADAVKAAMAEDLRELIAKLRK